MGLTPRQLRPEEYEQLLGFGIGLTDLAKEISGNDDILSHHHFDGDRLRADRPVSTADSGVLRESARHNSLSAGRSITGVWSRRNAARSCSAAVAVGCGLSVLERGALADAAQLSRRR